jgi:uncharacterized ferritin-like protein (DUF455 family)
MTTTTSRTDSAASPARASSLDPTLFADGPARDARFVVKERWIECESYPVGHPLHEVEFTHRQMNEEINGLDCSARCLSDFPEADWNLRMELAHQCSDEARHGRMFRGLLESRGGYVGQFPVMNFQYCIITNADTLVGRLTIQNRTFEAGGIDAVSSVVDKTRAAGEDGLADFFASQLADEIRHVRFANDWIRNAISADPKIVVEIGRVMQRAAKAFTQVMGTEAGDGLGYPADRGARLEAGFTNDEVDVAERLAVERSARSAP